MINNYNSVYQDPLQEARDILCCYTEIYLIEIKQNLLDPYQLSTIKMQVTESGTTSSVTKCINF